MHGLPPEAEMYTALVARDASYEGIFFACVKTTGIFCRPTCRARKPRAGNVEYVPSATAALHAGYRACKVCRPLEPAAGHPAWIAPLLERLEKQPDRRLRDADLEQPARVRRYFKRRFGVTFQAYQRALRLGAAMRALSRGETIAAAAYDSGYESESGFREAFAKLFGAPPGRARGRDCLHAHWLRSPLGPLVGVASARGVVLLEFVDRRALERELRALGGSIAPGANDHLRQLESELDEYFAGARAGFEVALDPRGTPFQRAVWERLGAIPYGETTSYAAIAAAVGKPGASRAVGRANGTNQIAVVIPCHRVVRMDGALSGYGGGVWRKQYLLDHERSVTLSACRAPSDSPLPTTHP